jgi:hypothetical protein
MVEQSPHDPHHLKVKSSNPATASASWSEKMVTRKPTAEAQWYHIQFKGLSSVFATDRMSGNRAKM